MIKLNSSRMIHGVAYAAGDQYEGSYEAYVVDMGWAEFVDGKKLPPAATGEIADHAPPAEAMVVVDEEPEKIAKPKKKRGRRKKKVDDD